jgi:quinol monooxygenase YgiN
MRSPHRSLVALCSLVVASGVYAETLMHSVDTVVELRQYTLHASQRDTLIDIFERHFVEDQEAFGLRVVGTFRDLDNPDRFIWLRSFKDMPTRATALRGFYSSETWKSQRNAANATMIDSDNVLLLRPARADAGFPLTQEPLRPVGDTEPGKGIVVASIVYLREHSGETFVEFFDREIRPQLEHSGASPIAEFVTETGENNFPQLPVRSNERVFVWFSLFADVAAYEKHRVALTASQQWRTTLGSMSVWTFQPIQTLRFAPTARSRLRG